MLRRCDTPYQGFLHLWPTKWRRDENTKSDPFEEVGYALMIPLNESCTTKTKNSFPSDDFRKPPYGQPRPVLRIECFQANQIQDREHDGCELFWKTTLPGYRHRIAGA